MSTFRPGVNNVVPGVTWYPPPPQVPTGYVLKIKLFNNRVRNFTVPVLFESDENRVVCRLNQN